MMLLARYANEACSLEANADLQLMVWTKTGGKGFYKKYKKSNFHTFSIVKSNVYNYLPVGFAVLKSHPSSDPVGK